ncbi:hypothetical protein CC2G_000317 [Coprinopsis cinerea AmutBmut pab1-1]|nr:hypothetical protein CC2G_000317 [Coprinopsis cinerea AmutBmut pab1-1]
MRRFGYSGYGGHYGGGYGGYGGYGWGYRPYGGYGRRKSTTTMSTTKSKKTTTKKAAAPVVDKGPKKEAPAPLAEGPPLLQHDADPTNPNGALQNKDHPDYWFYGLEAGGYVMPAGIKQNQKINAIRWGYLDYCSTKANYPGYRDAFERYRKGLLEYMDTHYMEFVVPFGRFHGKKLYEKFKDAVWLSKVDDLGGSRTNAEYYIFFMALDKFIAKPTDRSFRETVALGLGYLAKIKKIVDTAQPPPPSQPDAGEPAGEEEEDYDNFFDEIGEEELAILSQSEASESGTAGGSGGGRGPSSSSQA